MEKRPARPCGYCGKERTTLRCPCKGESYCGVECQKAVWSQHKKTCTLFLAKELEKKRKEHGDDSSEVAQARAFIAGIFQHQRHLEDAKRNSLEALRIFALLPPPREEHNIGTCLYQLGLVYKEQGKNVEAQEALKRAFDIFVSIYGKDHEIVGAIVNGIGETCRREGKLEEAEKNYEEAIRIFRATDAPDELLASVFGNLGCMYRTKGMQEKSMENLVESIRLMRVTGCDKRGIATNLVNIAKPLVEQRRLDEALGHLTEALPMLRSFHGEKSPQTADALNILGHIYSLQGKLDDALNVHNKALRYLTRGLGDGHREVAVSITDIASVHMKKNEFRQALVMLEDAERIHCTFGDADPALGFTCINIASCKEELGDRDGALASAKEAYRILSKSTGAGYAEQAARADSKIRSLEAARE
jgi:tetratricopeptide (TPR) repeat protein